MHVYIYDSFLNQRKYGSLLAKIETRITDLGLNGKVIRIGPIKNIRETVENEIRRGAKTIIAVGDDGLISQVIESVADTNIPLGMIPVDTGKNAISEAFGIVSPEQACDILSARRIEKVDLGTLNNGSFFISNLTIPNDGTIVQINQEYSIESAAAGETMVINMPTDRKGLPENFPFNPQDGSLELIIKTQKTSKLSFQPKETIQSILPVSHITIINTKNHPVLADGVHSIPTPVNVGINKNSLNIIVGKDRIF